MSAHSSSLKIIESPDVGRFIAATRDYAIGDIILDEAPLLIIRPLEIQRIKSEKESDDDAIPVSTCIGCFKIDSQFSTSCPRCRWCLCCQNCSDEPFHKSYECEVFKNNNIQANDHVALGHLSILRACLMYKDHNNPSKWQDIAALSSKMETQTDYFKAIFKKEIRYATQWINYVCKIEVDATIVEMILGIFIVNGFGIHGEDENGFWYEAAVLYKMGSLFSHSCSPNTEWIILPNNLNGIERWHLRIYAMRNISCDEPITIPYVQDFLTSDTATRQKIISTHYHFHCRCERCLDPSEFNFNTAALKCQFCGNPTVLPDDSSSEASAWTCNVCGRSTDCLAMKNFVDDYENSLLTLKRSNVSGNVRFMESFLEMLINSSDERNLSPNHRAVTRTIFYWIRVQNFKDLLDNSMESQLKFIKIMERATKCLKMMRFFGTLRSIACLELVFAYTIASYYFKTEILCTIEYDDYSPDEKRQIVSAVYRHMKIAVQIIHWNPYNTLNSSIRDTALLRFKFWKKEWKALKDFQAEGREMCALGYLGNGTIYVFEQAKIYVGTFWTRLLGYLLKTSSKNLKCELSSMEKGVVAESANVSELIVRKPDVSLLSHYDFHFTN